MQVEEGEELREARSRTSIHYKLLPLNDLQLPIHAIDTQDLASIISNHNLPNNLNKDVTNRHTALSTN